jgi:hypothetical protein
MPRRMLQPADMIFADDAAQLKLATAGTYGRNMTGIYRPAGSTPLSAMN